MARPRTILEVGCGPGDLASRLLVADRLADLSAIDYTGTDVSEAEIASARSRWPDRKFQAASVYELPFDNARFDLVIACELFEHLDDGVAALAEVERVCAAHLLISVPWEPTWRILNCLRLKYIRQLGNTPGHLRHFSRTGIRRLVRSRFEILAERNPFPWTMLLARRGAAPVSLRDLPES